MTYASSSATEHRRNTPEVGEFDSLPRVPSRKWALGWHEKLGLPECPYLIRWRLEAPFGSIRLHHWISSDDGRARHDHPWWFATLVLRGGYTDVGFNDEQEVMRPGFIRFRKAFHRHTVQVNPGGAWTILITGPIIRYMGFWPNGKFKKANKYFLEHGHHPCA